MTYGAASGNASTAAQLRGEMRRELWTGPTSSIFGFLQANVILLPEDWAADFREFCLRNPRPAPLIHVTAPGVPDVGSLAPDANLVTDLPAYRVYREGELVAEPQSLEDWYRDDLVAFVIGCSFTFESALLDAGVRLRHIELGRNVSMFDSAIPLFSVGPYHGQMVVSMRPVAAADVNRVVAISRDYPIAHGEPVAVGHEEFLGIDDLARPDYGDPCPIGPGETPLFWPCGVTAEFAARKSGCPYFISHSPGHMLVTDVSIATARNLLPLEADRPSDGRSRN